MMFVKFIHFISLGLGWQKDDLDFTIGLGSLLLFFCSFRSRERSKKIKAKVGNS